MHLRRAAKNGSKLCLDCTQGGDARRDGQGEAAAERGEGDRVRHDRMSLRVFAGYMWKLHHWSNQRCTREFYSLLDQGKISAVVNEPPPAGAEE